MNFRIVFLESVQVFEINVMMKSFHFVKMYQNPDKTQGFDDQIRIFF